MKHNKEIETIFKSLIQANLTGAIADTIWQYDCNFATLWEYIIGVLDMSEEEYEEFCRPIIEKLYVKKEN